MAGILRGSGTSAASTSPRSARFRGP